MCVAERGSSIMFLFGVRDGEGGAAESESQNPSRVSHCGVGELVKQIENLSMSFDESRIDQLSTPCV
jgi:hypothetical protein